MEESLLSGLNGMVNDAGRSGHLNTRFLQTNSAVGMRVGYALLEIESYIQVVVIINKLFVLIFFGVGKE